MKEEIQAAWARAVNNKDNMPSKDKQYGTKIKGKLQLNHYIVYNIIRGLPIDRGLNNIKPLNKDFSYTIRGVAKSISKFDRGVCYDIFSRSFIEDCLFPYEGLIDPDTFREKADEALRLYSNS